MSATHFLPDNDRNAQTYMQKLRSCPVIQRTQRLQKHSTPAPSLFFLHSLLAFLLLVLLYMQPCRAVVWAALQRLTIFSFPFLVLSIHLLMSPGAGRASLVLWTPCRTQRLPCALTLLFTCLCACVYTYTLFLYLFSHSDFAHVLKVTETL